MKVSAYVDEISLKRRHEKWSALALFAPPAGMRVCGRTVQSTKKNRASFEAYRKL
jgi:hypothetical protein